MARVRPRLFLSRLLRSQHTCSFGPGSFSNGADVPLFRRISREVSSASASTSTETSNPSVWSLDRLTDIPTASAINESTSENEISSQDITPYNKLLFELVQDINVRLVRQNDSLAALKELVSSNPKNNDPDNKLDRVYKTIRDFQHLHKDTHEKCCFLLFALQKRLEQSQSSSINPSLLLKHTQQTLQETYTRHSLTMESLAEMVTQVRTILPDTAQWNEDILDFLRSRVGLQLLTEHGSQLAKQQLEKHKKQEEQKLGVISKKISIWELIEQSVTESKHLCEAHYLHSPTVVGIPSESSPASLIPPSLSFQSAETAASGERKESDISAESLTVTYVRPWIQFALVELFKNSMAITAHRQLMKAGIDGPQHYYNEEATPNGKIEDDGEFSFGLDPIYVQVHGSEKFVEIQILDQAGGIDKSKGDQQQDGPVDLFSFCQTRKVWDRMEDQQTYAMTRSPLHGLGVGLCMSRMYLQHFGGTLEVEDRSGDEIEQSLIASHLGMKKGVNSTLRIPKNTSILSKN